MKLPRKKMVQYALLLVLFSCASLNSKTSSKTSTNTPPTASSTKTAGSSLNSSVSEADGEVPIVSHDSLADAATRLVLSTPHSAPAQKAATVAQRHINPQTSAQELAANPQTAGAEQITFTTKTQLPSAAALASKANNLSFTFSQQKASPFKPNAGLGNAASAYSTFTAGVEATPGACPIFRRLYVTALQQIYSYLLNIYIGLNLNAPPDIGTYANTEKLYALNKKTLIIGHLIDIIESQFNMALRSLFPQIPQNVASYGAMMAIQGDHATKIDTLVTNMEEIVYQNFQVKGIFPDEWACALTQLNNKSYASVLSSVPSAPLASAKDKINKFVTVSMDLGGTDQNAQVIRDTYTEAPQTDYFKSVPSGAAWQAKVNDLTAKSVDSSILPAYPSLLVQLTFDEIIALAKALNIIVPCYALAQKTQDLDALIRVMKQPTIKDDGGLTKSQISLFELVVQALGSTQTLPFAIARIKELYGPVVANSTTPFTPSQVATIKMVTAFVCLAMEEGTADAIIQSVTTVRDKLSKVTSKLTHAEKAIFTQLNGSTAIEQRQLQLLANKLSLDEDTVQDLSTEDRKILSDGFIALSKQTNTFHDKATQDNLKQLATLINQTTFTVEKISANLQDTYATALSLWDSYDPPDYTAAQSQKDLYVLFPQKDSKGNYIVDTITNGLDTADSNYLDKKTPSELLMILAAFQGSSQVVETRVRDHLRDGGILEAIFSNQQAMESALYAAVGATQYMHLVGIYEMANTQTPGKPLSCADLGAIKQQILLQILELLVTPPPGTPLAKVPPDLASNSSQNNTSPTTPPPVQPTTGYLNQIQAAQGNSSPVQYLPILVEQTNIDDIMKLYEMVRKYTFKMSALSESQKRFVAHLLKQYQKALPSIAQLEKEQEGSSISPEFQPADEEGLAITLLAPILQTYTNMTETQKDGLKVLGLYLNFAHAYTELLMSETGSLLADVNTQNQQAGPFIQSVQALLGQAAVAQTSNPPLFFYDNQTVRHIDAITSLAVLVDGSQSAPYPLHAIEAALSTNPTKDNVVTSPEGTVITLPSLTVSAGKGTFSPQFFFKDQFGKAFSNSANLSFPGNATSNGKFTPGSFKNTTLAWLVKTAVPAEQGTAFVYAPAQDAAGNRILPKGQEGLYMNVYMTVANKTDSTKPLLRFYEQPIAGQPNWLNSKKGILTMLRICFGDFASTLSLDEQVFDPVVDLTIREGLATLPQIPANLVLHDPNALTVKTLAWLLEHCNLQLIKAYIDEQSHREAAQQLAAK